MRAFRRERRLRQRRPRCRTLADGPVGRPGAGHGGQCGGRAPVRADRLVSAAGERHAGADGRARRQRRVRFPVVRDQPGRRLGRGRDSRPTVAPRHDGGRHRPGKLWPVHRHRGLVRSPSGHHAVRFTTNTLIFCFCFFRFVREFH